MPLADSLKEEILEVFKIFDEDNSGTISTLEFCRALYAILGERIPRSEVVRLVEKARAQLKSRRSEVGNKSSSANGLLSSNNDPQDLESSLQKNQGASIIGMNWLEDEGSDNVSPELFEMVVRMKLNSKSDDDELVSAFALLEDKYYPGFVTKESVLKAAAEADEPLTEAEVNEMFDPLVTGVPSAAIDFQKFCEIQKAAQEVS